MTNVGTTSAIGTTAITIETNSKLPEIGPDCVFYGAVGVFYFTGLTPFA